MDSALVISWTAPVPGRASKGLELVVALEKYWGNRAAEGCCTTPDIFFLPNGPGTVMVKGKRQVLEKLATGGKLRGLLSRGLLLFQDWQYRFVETDSRAETVRAAGDWEDARTTALF
jgi:hypothetical protein